MQDKQHVLDIKIDLDGQKKISKKKTRIIVKLFKC